MGLLPKDVPVRVSIAAWYWGAYLGDEAVNQVSTFVFQDGEELVQRVLYL